MKNKQNVTIYVFIFLVVLAFAIEEAIKDYDWFEKGVGMIQTLIENIGEIGLAVATILFVVRWVKISKKDIELRLKELESNEEQNNDNIKIETVNAKERDTNKLRFVIEMIRFSNYTQLDIKYRYSDGMIDNFIRSLKDEKIKVKEILIKKYNYRATEADKIINKYYSNYK
ncbi:MAG: hypothetical protein K8R54_17390 [Bacteroidales bacterium]|nr:hypothetical protein [Bacteroidales bacterium]